MNIQELVTEFVDEMNGSCNGTYHFTREVDGNEYDIDQLIELYGFSESDFWGMIDDKIFNCATCGWWSETSEMSEADGELICDQCYEDDQNG